MNAYGSWSVLGYEKNHMLKIAGLLKQSLLSTAIPFSVKQTQKRRQPCIPHLCTVYFSTQPNLLDYWLS